MLTLEKFEEASEIVKKVTPGYQAGVQRLFQCTDRKQSLFKARKHAVDRRLQIKRCLL